MFLKMTRPWEKLYRNADAGAGAGGDAGADDKGAPDKNGGNADGNGGAAGGDTLIDLEGKGAPAAGERPAYIPETLWDKDKKSIKDGSQDALLKELETAHNRATGLRKELGKGAQNPPAKAEDYKLPDFSKDEKDKPLAEIFKADDPFVKGMGGVFHKHGVSQSQYEGIMKDAGHLLAGMKAEAGDGAAELTPEQVEAIRTEEFAKIGPNAPRIAAAVSDHFKGLIKQGHFGAEEITEIKAMASTAAGLTVLNKIRSLMGGESIPTGDSVNVDGLLSDAEIQGMIGSKEYLTSSDPGHAAMHQKVERQLTLRQKAGRPERLQA